MDLGRMDHVAMRAAEQVVVRTSAADRPTPRRTAVIGTRVPIVLDPERIDALADAGYMTDADDRDTDPSRGRRRLIATERGRIEWRCACAEDPALEMEMDDIFRRAGEIVTVDIDDRRYFVTGSEGPLPQGDEWTVTHDPADPENDIEAMTCYRRIVAVDAIANHLGELLTSWNPTDREPVGYPRMPAYPTGSRIIMSAAIMIALDGAVRHRLYYQGGHTHIETRCGTRGLAASSEARNMLLRFGLIRAIAPDMARRREDFAATPRGIAFHARVMTHQKKLTGREADEWARYVRLITAAMAA